MDHYQRKSAIRGVSTGFGIYRYNTQKQHTGNAANKINNSF